MYKHQFMKRLILILFFAIISLTLSAQPGTANASLRGRTLLGNIAKPSYEVQKEGTVVVTIWVDQYGTVTKAQAGAPGTTVNDATLWAAARSAAMKTHFNQSADAPALQEGTITYVFSNGEIKEAEYGNKATAQSSTTTQNTVSTKYAKLYFVYTSTDPTMIVSKWNLRSIELFDENGKIEKISQSSSGKSAETIVLNKIVDRGYKIVNTNTTMSQYHDWTCMVVDYLLEKN